MEFMLLNIQRLFRAVLRMSFSAGVLVAAALALRLVLRKAPKWIRCLLWALVAVRLLCPVLPEGRLSLMPREKAYKSSEQRLIAAVDEGLPMPEWETPRDREINESHGAAQNVRVSSAAAPGAYLPPVWALGVLGMLLYALWSYLRLRRRTAASAPFREGVFLCDGIDTPFILGVFRPRICIPSHMDESRLSFVLAHERAHLRRRDHWWKPLGFLLLSVHWFNPLLWLAYILLCRDIELACDERVVREMSAPERADYSQALLDLSRRRGIAACPLAFGEAGVKQRVKGILNYKKPALWIVAAALLLCLLAALCFLTEPASILPGAGEITAAEYASLGENIPLPPEAWTELTQLIENHRGRRFPVGADDPGTLSRSVSLWYEDGRLLLVHGQYYSGFDLLRGREDDYRTIITSFDAAGKARKAWRMEESFDEAFMAWKDRWISRQENALDWMWKHYEVQGVLYDSGRDDPRTELRQCAINDNYELLISTGEAGGEWQRIGRLEPFTPEKSSFDGRYGYYAAYDAAAALRKRNRMAWRAVTADAPDARFYDLFWQAGGEILLGAGWYDAGEAGDPYSDDSRVYRLYRLAGTLENPSEEAPDEADLRGKYPEYFGLSAFKGLELYVWQLGPGVLRCGLMEGTNRNKTSEEIWNLQGATAEEMKRILSTYDVPEEDISIMPFLHPVSSYIYSITEEYRAWLRELFFGSAAIAAPQPDEPDGPVEPGEPDGPGIGEAPLLTVTSGSATIVPYLHLRYETTWLEEEHAFLAGDGWPLEYDIQEYGDKIPILILEGELSLTLGENVSCGRPIRVYDGDLTLLVQQEDDSLDALYRLAPGDYWCALGVYRRGKYIPEAERYEGAGYDGVFRLWVPETGDERE